MSGEQLFYAGIVLMAVAIAAGIVAVILLRITGKHIKQQLDDEFGKKSH